jgi:hypothetical protein
LRKGAHVSDTQITVEAGELAALAARLPIAPGLLFPWDHDAAATSDEAVAGDLGTALVTIANAQASARLRLAGAGCEFEYGAWFATDGSSAALRPFDDHLLVEIPPRAELVGALLVDITGASSLRAIEVDVQIDTLAALLLGIVMDDARRDALMALAMGAPFVPRGVSGSDAPHLVSAIAERGAGLCALLVIGLDGAVPAADVDAVLDALDRLVATGYVTSEGDRFVPAGAMRELARRCLGMTGRVELAANWVADGAVERASMNAAQFGVHDLVVVECVGASVRIATQSAADTAEQARAFFEGAPLHLSAG